MPEEWSFRPMTTADLPELLTVQEHGAIVGLFDVFPQDTHPFPRKVIEARWRDELAEPTVAAYVAVDSRQIVGFAARRADELLHFGAAVETWGSGLAAWLHDELVATHPRDLRRLWLWVFEANGRARRFYETLGCRPTGQSPRSAFEPHHPVLLEYVFDRSNPPTGG